MAATDKSEAAVIRDLVLKGVKAERLERAARDPVVNALLRAMNDVVVSHTARLERRLSLEFHTLRRLTATTIVLAHAAMRILETYVAVVPPPADAEVAARKMRSLTPSIGDSSARPRGSWKGCSMSVITPSRCWRKRS
jgi:hypothetical protein